MGKIYISPAMLYTAQQIANALDKPPSTIRHWATQYRDFLPRKKRGRFYVYKEEATEIFRRIAELQDRGFFKEQVMDNLQENFGTFEEGYSEPEEKAGDETSLVVREQYNQMMGFWQEYIKKQDEIKQTMMDEMKQRDQHHNEQMKILREELKILRDALLPTTKQQKEKPTHMTAKKPAPKKKTTPKKTRVVKAKTGRWTKEEVEKLQRLQRGNRKPATIAKELNRTEQSVKGKIASLKSPATKKQSGGFLSRARRGLGF